MSGGPPNLFIDARVIRPGMTGVGHYTYHLIQALAAEGARIRAAILPDPLRALNLEAELPGVEWVPVNFDYESHPSGDIALWRQMPKLVREGEIYHGPAFAIPPGRVPFKRVVTIHDLGVFVRPFDYPLRFTLYLRWMIKRAVKAADRIIVPSAAVASELEHILRVKSERVRTIPEAGATVRLQNEREVPFPGVSIPYIITLATLEKRKDPGTATEAFDRIRLDLPPDQRPCWFWLGRAGFGSGSARSRMSRKSLGDRRIQFNQGASRAGIDQALRGCAAFVYPSRYEGFGLPPLEAMAAGAPVVVSDIPALREVCGDAALYFPPGDAKALAETLNRLLADPQLAETMRQRGRERVKLFSWERTARETIKVYEELIV